MAKERDDIKRLKEAADLDQQLKIEATKDRDRKDDEIKRQQQMLRTKLSFEKNQRAYQEQRGKTDQLVKHLEESKGRHEHNTHVTSVGSTLMDNMTPRLKALTDVVTSKTKELSRYVVMKWAEKGLVPDSRWPDVLNPFISKPKRQPIDIPDLKYYANVSENGALSLDWVSDHLNDFMLERDASGEPVIDPTTGKPKQDTEKAALFQGHLSEAVQQWLNREGFFIGPKESDGTFRIYPKTVGEDKNRTGTYVLNEDFVVEHYEKRDCVTVDGKYVPKAGASPKPGFEPLYLKPDEFQRLRDDKDTGLGDFIENHFKTIAVMPESEEESRTRLSP